MPYAVPEWWAGIKYFKPTEFDSPDAPGSGAMMDKDFIKKLDAAREQSLLPFKINSGFRTKEHNKKVGGTPGSSHVRGKGADIAALTSGTRLRVVKALLDAGFTRVEVSTDGHVHVDDMVGPSYPPALLIELPDGRVV